MVSRINPAYMQMVSRFQLARLTEIGFSIPMDGTMLVLYWMEGSHILLKGMTLILVLVHPYSTDRGLRRIEGFILN